jgi:hypothetical protein
LLGFFSYVYGSRWRRVLRMIYGGFGISELGKSGAG